MSCTYLVFKRCTNCRLKYFITKTNVNMAFKQLILYIAYRKVIHFSSKCARAMSEKAQKSQKNVAFQVGEFPFNFSHVFLLSRTP